MKATTAELAAAGRGANKAEIVNRKSKIVNLVCADARLTNGPVRAKFLQEYEDDPALQNVWRELFREMEDIAQVGSLLRVEERFRQLLEEYNPASVAFDRDRQLGLPGVAQPVRQLTLAELPAAYEAGWTPRRTLADMLTHLRDFARHALEEADVNAQLFAVEAEKTLGLLDVLLQDYDVVVMNPPYGGTTSSAKSYIEAAYPLTKNDLYAAFFEKAIDILTAQQGYVGALTSRTYLQLPTFEHLRKHIFMNRSTPISVADLGFNILDDAAVETCAGIFQTSSRKSSDKEIVFINLTQVSDSERQGELLRSIDLLSQAKQGLYVYFMKSSAINRLPRKVFAYWSPQSLINAFATLPSMSNILAVAKTGLQTDDDVLYIRNYWEVHNSQRGKGKTWVPLAKGGDYSKYYSDVYLVVDWAENGRNIKNAAKNKWGSASKVVRNEDKYFSEGMTYPATTVKGFNARYLPSDTIFALKGPGIFTFHNNDLWYALGLLNSSLIFAMIRMLTPSRSFDVTAIGLLPIKQTTNEQQSIVSHYSHTCHNIKFAWDAGNEICTRFTAPWLLQLANTDGEAFETGLREVVKLLGWQGLAYAITLEAMLAELEEIEQAADAKLQKLQAQIDEAVYELYEISPADRALIERELGQRPPELVWPQMEGKAKAEKRREQVRRLLSYFILQALQADADGIVPLVEGTGQSTVLTRLREGLEAAFTHEIAFKLEDEARHILGKALEAWLEREFSPWHAKLYKNRPILWHLASPQGTFSALIYYHKLDRDTLPKVRNVYLWTLRDGLQKQLARAREAQNNKTIDRLESALDDLTVFDERLGRVIEAGYAPVIDEGVKANILPLQEAGVLRGKVV